MTYLLINREYFSCHKFCNIKKDDDSQKNLNKTTNPQQPVKAQEPQNKPVSTVANRGSNDSQTKTQNNLTSQGKSAKFSGPGQSSSQRPVQTGPVQSGPVQIGSQRPAHVTGRQSGPQSGPQGRVPQIGPQSAPTSGQKPANQTTLQNSGPVTGTKTSPDLRGQPNQDQKRQSLPAKTGPPGPKTNQPQARQSQPARSEPVKPQPQPQKPPAQPRSIFSSIFGDDTPVTPAEPVKPVQSQKPPPKPINTNQPAPTPIFQTMPKPMPRNSSGEKLPNTGQKPEEKPKTISQNQSTSAKQPRPSDYVDTSRTEAKKIPEPKPTQPVVKPVQSTITKNQGRI